MTAAMLAWKERLADFSRVLTANELRAAILMAILASIRLCPKEDWGPEGSSSLARLGSR
jgi:uncharacterized membrane protein (DUF4010 family)